MQPSSIPTLSKAYRRLFPSKERSVTTLQTYLTSLVVGAACVSLVCAIAPDGKNGKAVTMAGSLLFLALVLAPIFSEGSWSLPDFSEDLQKTHQENIENEEDAIWRSVAETTTQNELSRDIRARFNLSSFSLALTYAENLTVRSATVTLYGKDIIADAPALVSYFAQMNIPCTIKYARS